MAGAAAGSDVNTTKKEAIVAEVTKHQSNWSGNVSVAGDYALLEGDPYCSIRMACNSGDRYLLRTMSLEMNGRYIID